MMCHKPYKLALKMASGDVQPQEQPESQQPPFLEETGNDNPPDIKRRTGSPVSGCFVRASSAML